MGPIVGGKRSEVELEPESVTLCLPRADANPVDAPVGFFA
jgi:hypothetical protein